MREGNEGWGAVAANGYVEDARRIANTTHIEAPVISVLRRIFKCPPASCEPIRQQLFALYILYIVERHSPN